jgi:alkylhydroperoxidase/carboxymuconolactone decarboxylase family protein YurZ
MANSISKTVQNFIDEDLSLQDALQRDYANHSAIARILLPKVQESLETEVNMESVITAVKRAKTNYNILEGKITKVVAGSDLNIRTDMAKVSVHKTKETLEKIRKTLATFQGEFLQIIEGNTIITLISDFNSFNQITTIFTPNQIINQKQDLATIIIRSPNEITYTSGCVQAFYNGLSRRHINIEETMSCYTETIIVLAMENVSKAFAALTDLIKKARTKTVIKCGQKTEKVT